jgi:hypothetical protein
MVGADIGQAGIDEVISGNTIRGLSITQPHLGGQMVEREQALIARVLDLFHRFQRE